ncbi:MAG: hypothetical protein M3430_15010 [Acidobacteriota bacterium]|nr:hypothetical protein [Acidobacteriota bacterium]
MRKQKSRVKRASNFPKNSAFALPKLTPKMVVGSVASVIVLVLLFGGDIRRFFVGGYNPRISFARGYDSSSGHSSPRTGERAAQNAPVFDGEVYRTEGRLREASAIAIAASLSGISGSIEGRRPVGSVDELLAEIINRRLLPPSVEFVPEKKVFISQYSTIYLRFRPEPFGIEVLSLGRERKDGAGLLVRVPDDTGNGQKAQQRYFRSFRLENINVPEAFTHEARVLAAGWQTDYFDAELPAGANSEQLVRWTERAGRKKMTKLQNFQ